MPGICGFIFAEPEADAGDALTRMLGSLRQFDWQEDERWIAPRGNAAVGRVDLGVLPVRPDREAGAAADGRGVRRWVFGEEGDGFTRLELDRDCTRLTIENDRFGMMPVFYAEAAGGLVFGTELKAVLAHPTVECRVDIRGLADLLTFGFLLGEKTLVRGVRCLPGGARLEFSAETGELRLTRTAKFSEQIGRAHEARRTASPRRLDEMLDEAAEAFRRAVARRTAGDAVIGVSLSGGYDSRTLLAAVDHRRRRVKTLTLDVPGGADQTIAERIARRTNGLENHRFVQNSETFFARWPDYVREMVWLTDGMYYDEACVMMPTLDIYRDMGVGVVLRGHGGELARMHEAYELRCNRHVMACRTPEQLRAQLLKQMTIGLAEAELGALLAPELAREMRGAARASFAEAFAEIDRAWDVVDQASCLYVEQYLRRQCVPSLNQLRSRVEVRMPFLDLDYVASVLRLPPAVRITSRLHRHLLACTNPSLLSITNANNGARAGASDLVQRISRKGHQWLKRFAGYERFKHYVDVPGWLRGRLRGSVERVLLDTRTLERGLLRPQAVRGALEDHLHGRADRSAALLLLTYLEIWHRLFVDGEQPDGNQTEAMLCEKTL